MEFMHHSQEEQDHADALAQRIVQLDDRPSFDPEGLAERSHAEYVECDTLGAMIRAKEEEHAEELSSVLRQTATALPGAASAMVAGGSHAGLGRAR